MMRVNIASLRSNFYFLFAFTAPAGLHGMRGSAGYGKRTLYEKYVLIFLMDINPS
jgi:hypothetical protein